MIQCNMHNFGKLTLGAVPIGDYGDASINLINYITKHKIILVENVDVFNDLCSGLNIKTNAEIMNYGNHDILENIERYIKILKDGVDILFLSDEGTAGLIDPGGMLMQIAREHGIKVKVMAGPNSIIPSVILARFNRSFYFHGTAIDRDDRIKSFKELSQYKFPMVFFVTKAYLEEFIIDAIEHFGHDRHVFVCVNLTKKDEFTELTTLGKIYEELGTNKVNFSITLVISGIND